MTGQEPASKTVAIELREDEMMVVLISALTHRKPAEGMSTEEALSNVDPTFREDCRRAVRGLMDYWRGKITNEAGLKARKAAGLDDGSGQ